MLLAKSRQFSGIVDLPSNRPIGLFDGDLAKGAQTDGFMVLKDHKTGHSAPSGGFLSRTVGSAQKGRMAIGRSIGRTANGRSGRSES